MKRKVLLIVAIISVFIVGIICFTICASKTTKKDIQNDLENYSEKELISSTEKIKSIEITEERKDKNTKETTVTCIVITEDEKCSYEKEATLIYRQDKEKGKVLEQAYFNGEQAWTVNPLVGVSKEQIIEDLADIPFTAGGETSWYITKENVSSFSIEKQNTKLEGKKDSLKVALKIDDAVQQANGTIQLEYSFDREWKLDKVLGNEEFKAEWKPGMEFNITEEMLLSILDQKKFTYGVKNVNQQDILINKNELSDFSIANQTTTEKGTIITTECVITLKKNHASFSINAKIQYRYDEKWDLANCEIGAKCTAVSITGTWAGVGPFFDDPRIIKIESIDEKGGLVGTYTGTTSNKEFSYRVSGTLDFNSLFVKLEGGEMLTAKPRTSFKPYSISVFIDIEKGQFQCLGDGSYVATPQ